MMQTSEAAAAQQVHLVSLGCARNRVDAEVMLGTLLEKGWQLTEEPAAADAIVVNTCGFIGPAKQESIDSILEASTYKEQRPTQKLIVTGCLTQRYKTQLAKGLPEVDLFIGTDQFAEIGELINGLGQRGEEDLAPIHAQRTHYLYNDRLPRVNTLSKHAAYVKVAEGCQHNCAFCIIPAIRGRLRSRPLESVVNEVKDLVRDGVVEVNLIAQDLAAYGRDHEYQSQVDALNGANGTQIPTVPVGDQFVETPNRLMDLLKALVAIEGLERVRCLYMYPENISDEFLDFFASEPKIVKYLDIPVQHAADSVLQRMNRKVDKAILRRILTKVRENVPGVAIRTSVMVGFPGETDAEFEELRDFVEEQRFTHLGCFTYSQEEGTVAGRMKDQVDEDLKQERRKEIMELQQEVSRSNLEALVGTVQSVLVDGKSSESDLVWQGRLSTQAPEVDGVVYLGMSGSDEGDEETGTATGITPGRIYPVRIQESHAYDLVGEVQH